MSPRRRDTPPGPTDAERTVVELRRRVLDGELPPGTRLREEALAEEFQQSRHTIRRALDKLVAEHLLTAEAYRGISVTALTERDFIELQQMRSALESEAVRLIIRAHGHQWPADVLAPIEDAIDRLAAAAAADHDVEIAHSEVHQALVAAAANERIAAAYAGLSSEVSLFVHRLRSYYDPSCLADDHRTYLQAAMRHGESAVHDHLDESTQTMIAGGHR